MKLPFFIPFPKLIQKKIIRTHIEQGYPCSLTVEYDIIFFGLLKFRWCDSMWIAQEDANSREKIDTLANNLLTNSYI